MEAELARRTSHCDISGVARYICCCLQETWPDACLPNNDATLGKLGLTCNVVSRYAEIFLCLKTFWPCDHRTQVCRDSALPINIRTKVHERSIGFDRCLVPSSLLKYPSQVTFLEMFMVPRVLIRPFLAKLFFFMLPFGSSMILWSVLSSLASPLCIILEKMQS